MIYGARNGSVKIGDTYMDYVSFGKGDKNLVMIPGLGDGLKTVKGLAIAMAIMYRAYARRFKVYVFSRKNLLEKDATIQSMAKDQVEAMVKLGISQAHILGISQGGMIAQRIAIDSPGLVEKLVLAVTLARPNETVRKVIDSWTAMAASKDYKSLFIDTTEKSYTEKYKKRYRPFYPVLCKIGMPKDFTRFIIQANAILRHNAYDELGMIKCPALIIGAGNDQVTGRGASVELAGGINDCRLIMYEDYGHGVYTEAKDFNSKVMEFLL